jgi:geranylgeranyl transferase type-2 subunit alpha
LPDPERIQYLKAEIDKLKEMLPEADDCKWIYQRLVEMALEFKALSQGVWPDDVSQEDVRGWVAELVKLDPLRKGKWKEVEERVSRK